MQFKKTLLAASALMSAAAWAPQAHAIPAFARQVGMACSACHYQHFPVLNQFGRAFKAAGFTMVGSEEKIEGDGLSIPAVLNLAFVTNLAYTKTNGPTTGATPTTKTSNNGQFQMTQYSLFMGGRVGENIGFEGEVGLTGGNGGANLASVKLPFSYDMAGGKFDIIPFTTDGLGPQQGFEPLSDGATPVHLFNQQDMAAIGAYEYITASNPLGTPQAIPAFGAALVYYNDMGFVNFTKWGADSINGVHTGPGTATGTGSPTSNYLRLAWTPSNLIPGFDTAVGIQYFSGTSSTTNNGAAPVFAGTYTTKATGVDGQMMGDVGGMPLTFIASYMRAPASAWSGVTPGSAVIAQGSNLFNQGNMTKSSFNMGAELGVLPNKATVQLGIRRANAGIAVPNVAGNVAGSNATDNAIMVGATYNIALNVRAELTFSKYSGDMYNAVAQAAPGYTGDKMTTLNLWMGF